MNKTSDSSTIPCMDFISFDTPQCQQPPEEPNSSRPTGYQANYTIETENISNAEPLGSTPTANNESNLSEGQGRHSDAPNDISSMWEILRRASMSNKVKNSVSPRLPCNNTGAASNDASAESLAYIPYDNRKENNRPFIVGDRVFWIAENDVAEEGLVAWVGDMDSEPTAGIIFERPVGNTDGVFKHERYFKCTQNHGRFLPLKSLIHPNDDFSHNSRPNRISYEVSAYIQDLFVGFNTTDPLKSTNGENVGSEDIVTEECNDCGALAVATRPSSSQRFKSNSTSLEIHEEDKYLQKSEDIHRRKSDVEISHTSHISNFQPPVTLDWIPSGLKLSDRVVWVNAKEPVEGTVKWIGTIRGRFHAGVELDKPVGNSSGLYGYGKGLSKRFFTCKLSYGRFIPDDELIRYTDDTDYFQDQPDSEPIQHVSLQQYLPNNDSQYENSYGQIVAGNNIDDLLGLNDRSRKTYFLL